MPRNGAGVFSLTNPDVVTGTTISSAVYNEDMSDIVADLNTARPISQGGTGATSAASARSNLNVAEQQASTNDATSGRGLIVGAFGWGANAGTQTDFESTVSVNKLIRTGAASTANAPSTEDSWVGFNIRKNGGEGFQLVFDPANNYLKIKPYTGGAWGDWTDVVYVVETGSNSNGAWVKYSDGRLRCTFSVASPVSSTAVGNIFQSDLQTWTYPVPLLSTANARVAGSIENGLSWIAQGDLTTTTVQWRRLSANSSSSTPTVRLVLEGYWR